MLEARDIKVKIGRNNILHGVDFEAETGQLTAIVGPNGSGKTTLLKAMTGDLRFSGDIRLDGLSVSEIPGPQLAARRAVLPQVARLSFPFTVLEVVRLGLLSGLEADDDRLPSEALSRVGLHGFEGRFYHELSGGEQQRCQLARVLVQVWKPVRNGKSSWLFLDEPVSALDIGHQLDVMSIARRFADDGGSVVAVMHDLNLTSMFSDCVLLMNKGQSVIQGHPVEVLTDAHLTEAYRCNIRVNTSPDSNSVGPFVLPQSSFSSGSLPLQRVHSKLGD